MFCLLLYSMRTLITNKEIPKTGETRTAENPHVETTFREGNRFIVTFRDPRAVAVSLCNFHSEPVDECVTYTPIWFLRFFLVSWLLTVGQLTFCCC